MAQRCGFDIKMRIFSAASSTENTYIDSQREREREGRRNLCFFFFFFNNGIFLSICLMNYGWGRRVVVAFKDE
jgi:hypothetical protein